MTNEREPDEHDDERERWRADEDDERDERGLEQEAPIAVYGSTCYGERYGSSSVAPTPRPPGFCCDADGPDHLLAE